MKYIISGIAVAMMIGSVVFGSTQQQFDKSIVQPVEGQFSKKMGERASELQRILDQGSLADFYKSGQRVLKELDAIPRDRLTPGDWNDFMWCFYLICGAPLYEVDYLSATPWPYSNDNDLMVKMSAASFIAIFDVTRMSAITGIHQKYLKKLNSLYLLSIIKSAKPYCNIDLNTRIKKLREKELDALKDNFDEARMRLNNITIVTRRHALARDLLALMLEEQFVEILIKYFPENANEVLKYIKMAGYQGTEISDLIDRTVGRNGKTEYLYKGRIGQEHKKKMKSHDKNLD